MAKRKNKSNTQTNTPNDSTTNKPASRWDTASRRWQKWDSASNKWVDDPVYKGATTTYKPCHTGNVALAYIRDKDDVASSLYFGGWTRGAKSNGMAVIDLTGTEYQTPRRVLAKNKKAETAFAYTIATASDDNARDSAEAWLSMPITDFYIPTWGIATWKALTSEILSLMTAGKNVLVACTGGHGRTGLAASIILSLMEIIPAGTNPVEYVRSRYCDSAVETAAQERYVYNTLGLPFTVDEAEYGYTKGAYSGGAYSRGGNEWADYPAGGYATETYGTCSLCSKRAYLVNDTCEQCENALMDNVNKKCAYCWVHSNELVDDGDGNWICPECAEWMQKRYQKDADAKLCSYCGDNVDDNDNFSYNGHAICATCANDLFFNADTKNMPTTEKQDTAGTADDGTDIFDYVCATCQKNCFGEPIRIGEDTLCLDCGDLLYNKLKKVVNSQESAGKVS